MPRIDIEREHHLDTGAARGVVDKVAAAMQEKYGMAHQWQGDVLHFSGPGVTGSITVTAHAVHVAAQLGMLLSPLKSRIERDIGERLDRYFA
ncbi:MAG: polyhydroxyalkanoic acid system family protein [Rhodanobacter sp.]